ncbi:hypothetical protein DesLBE_4299 [Desulfitobacterium sp. LBE]|uniref:Uncharacterized protein n=1 Tax=bioreactor metagenome TaxID=1076179 RepID=A0A644TWW9_9ZZZZ|nr:hypothetical protein DesLBE_0735 [Desulfitobacterium sp. LBE]TWH57744.1 hypothetical protein DesLBE_2033 [Desulfitobacterium sp. LBE]TWH59114.1 hypothetical protein DesLBE_3484 [Desulfitobacterium sp. LBE]TWH59279.1 hypothetical protein DesLBE_3652 [Desulfitobacterium sp. LBE]TWH59891.1 hypothetical protein DesLBE_4299 [Desulfitobacterium sp. LBE]
MLESNPSAMIGFCYNGELDYPRFPLEFETL